MSASENALAVLQAASPDTKVEAVNKLASDWYQTQNIGIKINTLSDTPERPDAPKLVPPSDVKRRRLGSPAGRGALLHAIAHIEFNAIDLAADMIARFGHHPDISDADRLAFISDWISVCHDEARHFSLLQTRLAELGMFYGDLPRIMDCGRLLSKPKTISPLGSLLRPWYSRHAALMSRLE